MIDAVEIGWSPASIPIAPPGEIPMITRRRHLAMMAATGAAALLPASCSRSEGRGGIPQNRAPLQPSAFLPLPLGAVTPRGWLREQLQIQANGLTGHLDEFWDSLDPAKSGWRGAEGGESWERGPYYLDGLVPLAYLLGDERLIAKAKDWVSWTIENQRPDGSIGPDPRKGKYSSDWQATDWWPNMIMMKVLTQYAEATGDPRVAPLLEKYLLHHLENAAKIPLVEWARVRWAEELLSIAWVYNRTGNQRLLELARLLAAQGYDWKGHFANFEFPGKVTKQQAKLPTHVVNNAMALKTSAVHWMFSGDPADRESIYQLLRVMDEHHLMPNGVHGGDEHYAGNSPVQGTELCAVVEAMFSYEVLLSLLGDPMLGDRLERAAFNALPATLSGDMWTHQYDQQPNQVLCTRHPRKWTTNGPDSNLFGLEPNFGCCTANYHQGWPKYVVNQWMATPDGGLAAMAWGPNRVVAMVRDGREVRIETETDYPFRGEVTLSLDLGDPATFPLALRIPGWAEGASVKVNGQTLGEVKPGTFARLEREWKRGDEVAIAFPMPLRTSKWFNQSVAVERGPLVFALNVGTEWKKIRDAGRTADYELHPTTPWNYALALDPADPKGLSVTVRDPGAMPFSADSAPIHIDAPARKLPGWQMEEASAAPPPQSPVVSKEALETVTLIPYGSAKLRITAFPWLGKPEG
ncbi:MAG: glycoside hydrolase family 127 protein [Bryobacterales bacterium]|nr:glycoside hydrolase family 127 protein [Bryobacterales bacterium]